MEMSYVARNLARSIYTHTSNVISQTDNVIIKKKIKLFVPKRSLLRLV